MIEDPASKQQPSSFVRFTERLCSRDAKQQNCSSIDRVLYLVDRREGTTKSIKIVGFVEPLVLLTDCTVELQSKLDRGSNQ